MCSILFCFVLFIYSLMSIKTLSPEGSEGKRGNSAVRERYLKMSDTETVLIYWKVKLIDGAFL